jgi:uncharacterized integral membrane protein
VVLLAVALLVLIVVLQNSQQATFRFLFWSVETTQLFLVVMFLVVGFATGFITGKLTGRRKSGE